MSSLYYESSFAHHGILGQKWGIRRYQNKDGTLTSRGQKRYSAELQKISASQKAEQRRLALEKAKVREARKTQKAKLDLEKEKQALREEKALKNRKSGEVLGISNDPRKKKYSDMTNEELADLITRIKLEKSIAELTAPPKKEMNPFVREVGKTVLTSLGTELSKSIGTSIQKSLTYDMDMKTKESELKKQKIAWKREDDLYKKKRLDQIADTNSQWEHELDMLAKEQQFGLDHPEYIPLNRRQSPNGKKKKKDDDDD